MADDPMEKLIAAALDAAGWSYTTEADNPSRLDFRLQDGVEIEVKRFHSPRIAEQMARAENVIVAQGKEAVEFLAGLIVAAGMALEQKQLEEVQRGIFQNVEQGLMQDHGDGTYSLTAKGIAHVKGVLGGTEGGEA